MVVERYREDGVITEAEGLHDAANSRNGNIASIHMDGTQDGF